MSATNHYTVYGLHLASDRPLPEALPALPPELSQTPVTINLVEHIPALPNQPDPSQPSYYAHPYRDANAIPANSRYNGRVGMTQRVAAPFGGYMKLDNQCQSLVIFFDLAELPAHLERLS